MTMLERDGELSWKVHTPNLIRETLNNKGSEALRTPLTIFGRLLADVAERAAELDDPALNLLMLRLTLYDQGDREKHSPEEISAVYEAQRARLAA